MKIMVSIDGSDHSEIAVAETCRLPWPPGSELLLVTSVDAIGPLSASQKTFDLAKELLEKSSQRIKKSCSDIDAIKTQLLKGNPKAEILKVAESYRPDLLILGSRGRKGLHRMLLGSVSHALLLTTGCSVRIARKRKKKADGDERNKKVILSLDDSDSSTFVAKQVAERPWPAGTEFLCVSAVPSLAQMLHEDQNAHSVSELEEARYAQIETVQRMLSRCAKTLAVQVPNILTSFEIIDGDPREAVVEKAEQWDADLIMTGCKGKQLLDRIMIGSVSEAIATWSKCSVEVVKQ